MNPNPVIAHLPILILSPHSRCNCRCVMCDIWKRTDADGMTDADFARHLRDMETLGVEWVVFTGGEPLMHPGLFRFCALLRERGIRRTLLSTGLLLNRYAAQIADGLNDATLSLDGPPDVHNRIRRVPGAFEALREGVKAIHAIRPGFPISARCTVQHLNCAFLEDTVESARALGLAGISFLAADVTSDAFNRPGGWQSERQSEVALSEEDISVLEQQIERLIGNGLAGKFVAEAPAKLRRIAAHFRDRLENPDGTALTAPRCNAPWVSAVLEADGTVRPCFFHRPIGKATAGAPLTEIVNSPAAIAFRERLDVVTSPVCRRCVCSLNWQPG